MSNFVYHLHGDAVEVASKKCQRTKENIIQHMLLTKRTTYEH